MKKIDVKIEKYINNSYEIEIGYNLFDKLISDLEGIFKSSVHRYAIITDSNVEKLYGRKLLAMMQEKGMRTEMYSITAGEKSKTREMKAEIEDRMLNDGFRKDSCIVALGGGVVTDISGFIAATFCRGIPIINYATTFLAAADASIGGKTAVDTPVATNMIGLIVQPKKVYIDLKTWETLDDEQMINGLSETIKHACIADYDFFVFLEENLETVKARDVSDKKYMQVLEYICEKNIQIKYGVVLKDELEYGMREILNLGHTVGRAIEAASAYKIPHGKAVALGMVAQVLLGLKKGYISEEQKNRVIELYSNSGLPIRLNGDLCIDSIISKMYADKKVRKDEIKFVFQKGIGDMMTFGSKYSVSVDKAEIEEVLKQIMY